MGRKHSDLRRRPAIREPKPRFTLFCEGERTEPDYFRALARAHPAILLEIKPAAGDPGTLARSAIAHRADGKKAARRRGGADSYEEQDQTWAVFDRDLHPSYEQAIDLCRRHNIGLARSNPCFELWLILHEAEFDRPDDHHQVQRHLRTLRPEYDPNGAKTVACEALIARVQTAEHRSEAQLARREQEGAPFAAPSTTVGDLTRAIRKAAGRSAPPPAPARQRG
ncbi:MAG: RloB family protein [Acetobacteraceae bacterium]